MVYNDIVSYITLINRINTAMDIEMFDYETECNPCEGTGEFEGYEECPPCEGEGEINRLQDTEIYGEKTRLVRILERVVNERPLYEDCSEDDFKREYGDKTIEEIVNEKFEMGDILHAQAWAEIDREMQEKGIR